MKKQQSTRRKYLQLAALVGTAGIAGCAGNGGSSGDSGGSSGDSGGSSGDSGGSSGGSGGSDMNWVYDQEQDPEDVVTALNRGDMGGDPATQWAFDTFAEQEGITVEPVVINPDNAIEAARTRLQGQDKTLDLIQPDQVGLWTLSIEGYFEEVSHAIDQENIDAWFPFVREAYQLPQPFMTDFPTREGIYGVPAYDEIWIQFVNMDILEEAGYDRDIELEDTDHMIEIAKDVQSQGLTDTPIIFPYSTPGEGGNIFMDFVVRAGGTFFDGPDPVFTSDGVRRGTEAFLSLFQEGVAPKGATSMSEGGVTQRFFSGDSAFMMNASSNIFLPGKELPIDKPAEEVARITAYPAHPDAPSDTPTISATPTGYCLSVFSTNKANAAKFLNFAGGYDAHKSMLVDEGNLGLRADVYDDDEVQEALPYTDVLQHNLENGTLLRYPNPGRMRQMVYSQTQAAIANDLSVDETVQRLQSEAESII